MQTASSTPTAALLKLVKRLRSGMRLILTPRHQLLNIADIDNAAVLNRLADNASGDRKMKLVVWRIAMLLLPLRQLQLADPFLEPLSGRLQLRIRRRTVPALLTQLAVLAVGRIDALLAFSPLENCLLSVLASGFVGCEQLFSGQYALFAVLSFLW